MTAMCVCVQATLPSKSGVPNSTFKPYMWGVALAYAAIAYCYFCVAFAGYWAFGNGVASNIMLSVERPHWLVAVANLLVVIHVFGSYQVCSTLVCCLLGWLSLAVQLQRCATHNSAAQMP